MLGLIPLGHFCCFAELPLWPWGHSFVFPRGDLPSLTALCYFISFVFVVFGDEMGPETVVECRCCPGDVPRRSESGSFWLFPEASFAASDTVVCLFSNFRPVTSTVRCVFGKESCVLCFR